MMTGRRPIGGLLIPQVDRASDRTHRLPQGPQCRHAALYRRRGVDEEGRPGEQGAGPEAGREAEADRRAGAERQAGRRRVEGWTAGCAAG